MKQNDLGLFALQLLLSLVAFTGDGTETGFRTVQLEPVLGVVRLHLADGGSDDGVLIGPPLEILTLQIVTNGKVIVGTRHVSLGTLNLQGTQKIRGRVAGVLSVRCQRLHLNIPLRQLGFGRFDLRFKLGDILLVFRSRFFSRFARADPFALILERLTLVRAPLVVVIGVHHPHRREQQQERAGTKDAVHQFGATEIVVSRRHGTEPSFGSVLRKGKPGPLSAGHLH